MAAGKLSQKQRAARTAANAAAAVEVLEAEMAAIHPGEDWKRFLELQAKLHIYSPSNVALIYAQHTAERRVTGIAPGCVAGFTTLVGGAA